METSSSTGSPVLCIACGHSPVLYCWRTEGASAVVVPSTGVLHDSCIFSILGMVVISSPFVVFLHFDERMHLF